MLETKSISDLVVSFREENNARGQTLVKEVIGYRAGLVKFAADVNLSLNAIEAGKVRLICMYVLW